MYTSCDVKDFSLGDNACCREPSGRQRMRQNRTLACLVPVLLLLAVVFCTPGAGAATAYQGSGSADQQDPDSTPADQQSEASNPGDPSDPEKKDGSPEEDAEAKAKAKADRDEVKQEKKQADEAAAELTKGKREEDVQEIEVAAKDPWLGRWQRFRTATRDISTWDFKEGMFRLLFGIRFQLDFTGGSESTALEQAVGPIEDSVNFRRATLFADGDIARRFHFRFEYDFAVDQGLKDAFIDNLGRQAMKSAALRVGHFKEPFSLERQTSRHYHEIQSDESQLRVKLGRTR